MRYRETATTLRAAAMAFALSMLLTGCDVATVEETILVTAESPVIDTKKTGTSTSRGGITSAGWLSTTVTERRADSCLAASIASSSRP